MSTSDNESGGNPNEMTDVDALNKNLETFTGNDDQAVSAIEGACNTFNTMNTCTENDDVVLQPDKIPTNGPARKKIGQTNKKRNTQYLNTIPADSVVATKRWIINDFISHADCDQLRSIFDLHSKASMKEMIGEELYGMNLMNLTNSPEYLRRLVYEVEYRRR